MKKAIGILTMVACLLFMVGTAIGKIATDPDMREYIVQSESSWKELAAILGASAVNIQKWNPGVNEISSGVKIFFIPLSTMVERLNKAGKEPLEDPLIVRIFQSRITLVVLGILAGLLVAFLVGLVVYKFKGKREEEKASNDPVFNGVINVMGKKFSFVYVPPVTPEGIMAGLHILPNGLRYETTKTEDLRRSVKSSLKRYFYRTIGPDEKKLVLAEIADNRLNIQELTMAPTL